ncbi:MAG: hypothetical protein EOP04_02105 [Proteobacteria bacterium]|nr:MAG: hypothetical protein EOP04_02105 [Pseudomonadota bacterium]
MRINLGRIFSFIQPPRATIESAAEKAIANEEKDKILLMIIRGKEETLFFFAQALELLAACEAHLPNIRNSSVDFIRSVHLIKGSSGNFTNIAKTCHKLEKALIEHSDHILTYFMQLKKEVDEFQEILRVRLEWDDGHTGTLPISISEIARLLDANPSVLNIVRTNPQDYISMQMAAGRIYQESSVFLNRLFNSTIDDSRLQIVKKPKPTLKIEHIGEPVSYASRLVLEKVLPALFLNSLDHGIESPRDRHRSGKDGTGTIFIKVDNSNSCLELIVEDDGIGLDLEKLREKALRARLIDTISTSDTFLADLIFGQGISTKDETTLISGRGVGMGMVKNALESVGARIEIVLKESGKQNPRPFQFRIRFAPINGRY